MIKLLNFVKGNKNLTHEQCIKHHRDVHVPLVLEVWRSNKGLAPKRYVAYYLSEAPNMPYDFIVEQWYEDENHMKQMQKFRESAAYIKIRKDAEIMTNRDLSKNVSVTFDQNVVI